MVAKPMFAFLNGTFQTCLRRGTSVRDSGLIVSAQKQEGEEILFFLTDCEDGRKTLNMIGEGIKICDYLVFYTSNDEGREVVCFLELKGGKQEEAMSQVISTYTYLIGLIKQKSGQKLYQNIVQNVVWKVCICLHGQASRGSQRIEKELLKKFASKDILIKHGIKHYKILDQFLREKR